MEIMYKVTGKERKALVAAIAEITGAKTIYKGAPTFDYEVDCFTIDKNGTLKFDDTADSSEIEKLIETLLERGYEAEIAKTTNAERETTEKTITSEVTGLSVQMPVSYFKDDAFSNLERIIEAKGSLIRKALGIDSLPIIKDDEKVSFPWFTFNPEDTNTVSAYTHFIYSICEMARNQKRISLKEKTEDNEKYAFRCFLLRLGFIGDAYKVERYVLLKNLEGSSAFKGGAK